jgi:hypothetical protein
LKEPKRAIGAGWYNSTATENPDGTISLNVSGAPPA